MMEKALLKKLIELSEKYLGKEETDKMMDEIIEEINEELKEKE